MPAIVPCPSCEKKLKVPDDAEGKKIRCPHCKSLLLITEDGLDLADGVAAKPAARPSKKRAADDEDDDDRPARKKGRDDDDDEDDRPRGKKRAADDDEEPEDEDRPSRRRKKASFFAKIPKWGWYAGGGGIAAIILIIVLILVLSGGGGPSVATFEKVSNGMTPEEVKKIMGEPTTGALAGGNGGMTWNKPASGMPKETFSVFFVNGKVASKSHLNLDKLGKDFMK